MSLQKKLLSAIDEATLLRNFKLFCEKNNDILSKQRLKNIISRAKNGNGAIKSIFIKSFQF